MWVLRWKWDDGVRGFVTGDHDSLGVVYWALRDKCQNARFDLRTLESNLKVHAVWFNEDTRFYDGE